MNAACTLRFTPFSPAGNLSHRRPSSWRHALGASCGAQRPSLVRSLLPSASPAVGAASPVIGAGVVDMRRGMGRQSAAPNAWRGNVRSGAGLEGLPPRSLPQETPASEAKVGSKAPSQSEEEEVRVVRSFVNWANEQYLDLSLLHV